MTRIRQSEHTETKRELEGQTYSRKSRTTRIPPILFAASFTFSAGVGPEQTAST